MPFQLKMGAKNTNLAPMIIIVLISASLLFEKSYGSNNGCNFPAIFNFGDSNSDTGAGVYKYGRLGPPYGQTWPSPDADHLRMSDGRLIIDFIAEKLGLPYLKGYVSGENSEYPKGANFAVSYATIAERGPMDAFLGGQLKQFAHLTNLSAETHNNGKLPKPEDYSKALYTLDIGQNDLTINYNFFDANVGKLNDVINQVKSFLENIYQLGGRTFWIHNTGPIGCVPKAPRPDPKDEFGCSKPANELAQEFNKQLKDMVYKLREQLKDASLVYVDIYSAKYSLFKDAAKLGFKEPLGYCCKHPSPTALCGMFELGKDGSKVFAPPCPNPKEYISYDGIHYTEAANHIVATSIMDGSLSDPPVPLTEACTKLHSSKTEL